MHVCLGVLPDLEEEASRYLSEKDQVFSSLFFAGHSISVTLFQCCSCSMSITLYNMIINVHDCIPALLLQNIYKGWQQSGPSFANPCRKFLVFLCVDIVSCACSESIEGSLSDRHNYAMGKRGLCFY